MLSVGLVGCASEEVPEITEYNLTISSTEGGSVTTPGEGTFVCDEGMVIDLVAEADEDYDFVNWTGDVDTVANVTDSTTTVTMDSDYSITAGFAYVEPIAAVWNADATFVADWRQFSPLGMHFLSVWKENLVYWVFHIRNYRKDDVPRSVIGLATTTQGITFEDLGIVLDIGGASQWVYLAGLDLFHQTGEALGNNWVATPGEHEEGFLSFGPYATDIAEGPNTVAFILSTDNTVGSEVVVSIDVHDATAGKVLATQTITRSDFSAPGDDTTFSLNYTQVEGNEIEFRTYWHGTAHVQQDAVRVNQGQAPFFDDRIASFPGIWKDGDTWYLVYEGADTSSEWPGDIGLATSTDGVKWIKDACNPILVHDDYGWESVNIGTPSLWKEGDTWYLFYHGFDGTRCRIGVATGSDLHSLTKYSGNPILDVGPYGSWDSGTAGKRSIVKEGDWYYMAYEGSTDMPYETAQWSTGLARSMDLLGWEKFAGNPILPQTRGEFGYDGPEWLRTPDDLWHIYFRGPDGPTQRATWMLLNR